MTRKLRQDGIRTLQHLQDRCRVDDITGCWIWAGALQKGTARVWLPDVGVVSLAGALRVLCPELDHPTKRSLVPTCGQVNCANPAHRKPGTRGQLFARLITSVPPDVRARMAAAKQAQSKVCSAAIAAEIRASTETSTVLAARYGVHLTHICRIKRGESWRPVAAGASVFSWGGAA